MAEGTRRRLAAIVSADVVGYSRLMGADETGTLAAMQAHRKELWNPTIEQFDGRVVGTAGDAILVEFASAVAAVESSIVVQQGMSERNADLPDDKRMLLRIGINVGEVIIEDDDIYGDGVNVAARLQALADPGGIALSDDGYRQVRDRLEVKWKDAGEHEVKNIARPIHVWRWLGESQAVVGEAPEGTPPLTLPDKPSIVVLPFDNMSDDAEQAYFADGLTEDIITDLSRFERLFVIARNTAFTYKGRNIDVPKVAKELGVHFVVEGSVRKAGNRVRITAQLIDGLTGSHLWAERYDGTLEDIFDLQEDVTRQVVGSIAPQIDAAEIERVARGERRFDEAYDLAWQSYAKYRDGLAAANLPLMEEGIALAQRALALNDKCSIAYRTLCWAYSMHSLYAWGNDPQGAADRALAVAEAAKVAMPHSDTAYFCLGIARSRKSQFDQAARDLLRAHELNPNDAFVLHILAWSEAALGDTRAARAHAGLALRLSPKDELAGVGYLSLAMAAFVEHDHADFVDFALKAIQAHPKAPIRRVMMVAYAAEIGDQDLLDTHLAPLTSFTPDFIASLFRGENRLFANDKHMELLLDGLRKAGLEP